MLKPLGFIYITEFGVILYYFRQEICVLSSCQITCRTILALHLRGIPAWLRLVSTSGVYPVQPLLKQGINQSRLFRAMSSWFLLSLRMDTVWANCCSAPSPAQCKSAFVCLDGIFCVSVCAHYFWSCHWVPLSRVRL